MQAKSSRKKKCDISYMQYLLDNYVQEPFRSQCTSQSSYSDCLCTEEDSALVGTRASRRSSLLRVAVDIRTRIGEINISSLKSTASIANVGNKHGRAGVVRVRRAALLDLAAASDLVANRDVSAVHVHLAVADVVEPSPGKDGIARGGIVGESEVPVSLQRTVANVRVDGLPSAALIIGKGNLAASAVVGGASDETERVSASGVEVGNRDALGGVVELVVALAGEVGTRGFEW